MEQETPNDQSDQLFLRSEAAVRKMAWLGAGAGLPFAGAAFGFAVALFARVDPISLQFMCTLPAMVGMGCLAAGLSLARTPIRVSVGHQGLTVEGRKGSKFYSWDDIAWSTVSGQTPIYGRKLILFDPQGKKLVKISAGLENFVSLTALVSEQVAKRTDQSAQRIRLRRLKKTGVLCAVLGTAMLAIGIFLAWQSHSAQVAARELEERGVMGQAVIVRRFLAPDRVTTRLEYRITSPDGKSATRDAELRRQFWNQLEGQTHCAVIYVPEDPDNSRLAEVEVTEQGFTAKPGAGYLIFSLAGVMSVFFLGLALMSWLGWDISQDSKTGKVSISRVKISQ